MTNVSEWPMFHRIVEAKGLLEMVESLLRFATVEEAKANALMAEHQLRLFSRFFGDRETLFRESKRVGSCPPRLEVGRQAIERSEFERGLGDIVAELVSAREDLHDARISIASGCEN
jgi:hypothetical protein